jgi:hypothetical protein
MLPVFNLKEDENPGRNVPDASQSSNVSRRRDHPRVSRRSLVGSATTSFRAQMHTKLLIIGTVLAYGFATAALADITKLRGLPKAN